MTNEKITASKESTIMPDDTAETSGSAPETMRKQVRDGAGETKMESLNEIGIKTDSEVLESMYAAVQAHVGKGNVLDKIKRAVDRMENNNNPQSSVISIQASKQMSVETTGKTENIEKREWKTIKLRSGRVHQQTEIPKTRMIVDGLIYKGTTLLSAKPKVGKTFLLLDMCLSVAEGKPFLNRAVEQCETAYLALEDKGADDRIQKNLNDIRGNKLAHEGFHFYNEFCGTLDSDFMERLNNMLVDFPKIGLVVIDSFSSIRGKSRKSEIEPDRDAREMDMLTEFANTRNIALIIIHHTNKRANGDIVDLTSGTTGLTAKADNPWVMYKDDKDEDVRHIHISGRSVNEGTLIIRKNEFTKTWDYIGTEDDIAENRIKENYEKLPMVCTIRQLVNESATGVWTGRSQQLIDEGVRITDTYISTSAKSVGKDINNIKSMLYTNDGIVYQAMPNGTAGTIHRFIKQRPISCDFYNPERPF